MEKGQPGKQQLLQMMGWVENVPMSVVRTIGLLEIFGAAGLILPRRPQLRRPARARWTSTVALIQAGGIVVHLSRREFRQLPFNIVLLAAAAATAWLATTWT